MRIECCDCHLILIAEDSLDIAYLKHIFNDDVKIIRECNKTRLGFHVMEEEEMQITFQKVEK